jgi:hypothetical protein
MATDGEFDLVEDRPIPAADPGDSEVPDGFGAVRSDAADSGRDGPAVAPVDRRGGHAADRAGF